MSLIQEHSQGWTSLLPKGIRKASDWLLLIPFGTYYYKYGIQKFTQLEGNQVLQHFKSLRGHITRCFKGLPIHSNHDELCGSISQMEVRDDGIWAIIKWNDIGQTLLHNFTRLVLSPTWVLRPEFTDVFTPFKLVKMHLTHPPLTKKISKTLKTKSITDNLLGFNAPVLTSRDHFLSLVDAHMKKSGTDYLESWNFTKLNNQKLYKSFQ